MKIFLWTTAIALLVIVMLVFIPMSNYHFVTTAVTPLDEEIVVAGSLVKTTSNVFGLKKTSKQSTSFIQCSLGDTEELKEEIYIATNPEIHSNIVDIVVTDNWKISLSNVSRANKHKQNMYGTIDEIVKVTRFDDKNEIVWEKILKGSRSTIGYGVALYNGLIYVTGSTNSPDFPVKNSVQETLDGHWNLFISCFDLMGNMEWSTFINGTNKVETKYFAVHQNHLYITGYSGSSDFPVNNTVQENTNGYYNLFISCFDLMGNMEWASPIYGTNDSKIKSFTVDQNHLYITGSTDSPDFPVKNAFQETANGYRNAFVSCFDLMGNMEWSTFINGTAFSSAQSCTVNKNHLFVTGSTNSPDFPVKNTVQDVLQSNVEEDWHSNAYVSNTFLVIFTTSGEVETSTFISCNENSTLDSSIYPKECIISTMDDGNILLAIDGMRGSDKNKLFEIKHDIKSQNTLLYIISDEGEVISYHYLF